jgi:hypothetical protein
MVQRHLRHRKADLDAAGRRGQRSGKADRIDIAARGGPASRPRRAAARAAGLDPSPWGGLIGPATGGADNQGKIRQLPQFHTHTNFDVPRCANSTDKRLRGVRSSSGTPSHIGRDMSTFYTATVRQNPGRRGLICSWSRFAVALLSLEEPANAAH